jgi:hypothetical protein
VTLLAVMHTLWRYKLVTFPVICLTVLVAAYLVAFKPPVYESSVEYLLFSPPPVPVNTTDPELLRGADNPYTRVGDMTVIAQLMSTRMSSNEARQALAAKGADPAYIVKPGGGFGFSTPTIEITGTGPTAQSAVQTADRVGRAMTRELAQMQKASNVAPRYRITVQSVVPAHGATLRPSGMLRGLVGVIAAGSVLLFCIVSILGAIATMRRERAGTREVPDTLEDGGHEPPPRRESPDPQAPELRWDTGAVELAQASAGAASWRPRRHVDDGQAP